MITLEEQVEAVRREIKLRKRVYPRRIEAGQMTQQFADEQVAVMEAVLATVEKAAAGVRLL